MFIATIKINGEIVKRVTPKRITKKNANSKQHPKAWYFPTEEAALAKAMSQSPKDVNCTIAISNKEGELLQVVAA